MSLAAQGKKLLHNVFDDGLTQPSLRVAQQGAANFHYHPFVVTHRGGHGLSSEGLQMLRQPENQRLYTLTSGRRDGQDLVAMSSKEALHLWPALLRYG